MNIPKRIAQTLMNALKGGVVPRIGLPYITVGRKDEINALLHDVDIIAEGGSAFRFIVGKYGSGKSFLLQTIRAYCMDRNFVVLDADLSPERRLQGTKGQGLATYRELIRNMSTKTRPEGGALPLILDRWISGIQHEVITKHGAQLQNDVFDELVLLKIHSIIDSLTEFVHGFDFGKLLSVYYFAVKNDEQEKRAAVLKWFRGEYANKTEVKAELGINICITDEDWYDYLKLFSAFLKLAGYNGMLILIDELVNIYKIPNSITRQYNYEKLLTIYNDALQGKSQYMGFIMCATPQAMEDRHRGIFSYEALRSRLQAGRFSDSKMTDLLAPVIRLNALTNEEMLILVEKLRDIHAVLYSYDPILTQDDLISFIRIEYGRIGADSSITPREVIRDFIELLNIIQQNPQTSISQLLSSQDFSFAKTPLQEADAGSFAEFEV